MGKPTKSGPGARAGADLNRSIAHHYDSLAPLYRAFWGEHIHHGLWLSPGDSARRAQIRLVEYLADRANVDGRERVLDVGCGFGATGRWLSAQLGCQVTGVTISRAQARLGRRISQRAGLDGRITTTRGNAASLPFAAEAFDIVWVIECMEHLVDKARFFRDAARLLRPGGRLALCTWQRGPGRSADDRLVRKVCEAFFCPSLASEEDSRIWAGAAGLELRICEDLTPRVRRTWEILIKRLRGPSLALVGPFLGREVRRFLDGFPLILQAYETDAMRYGLLVAERA